MVQFGLFVTFVLVVFALSDHTQGPMLVAMRSRRRWLPLVPDDEDGINGDSPGSQHTTG